MADTDEKIVLMLKNLEQRIELMSLKVESDSQKINASVATGLSEEKKNKLPIWTVITGVIGIPTAIVYLFIQIDAFRASPLNTMKTTAEYEKLSAEGIKARAEAQQILRKIEEESKASLPVSSELRQNVESLRVVVDRLDNAAQNRNQKLLFLLAVATFIFLFSGRFFGILLDTIGGFYNMVMNLVQDSIYNYRRNLYTRINALQAKRDELRFSAGGNLAAINAADEKAIDRDLSAIRRREAAVDRVSNIVGIVNSVTNFLLFRVIFFAMNIFIFFALYVPLFDYVASSLSLDVRASEILDLLFHLRLTEVAEKLVNVLDAAKNL